MNNIQHKSDFIQVALDPKWIKKAEGRSIALQATKTTDVNLVTRDSNSHTAGFIAESAFSEIYPEAVQETKLPQAYEYDFTLLGKRVEIKTKKRSVLPQLSYDCSVYDYNDQQCDVLVFASILYQNYEFKAVHFLGWIPKKEFDDKNFFLPRGEKLPNGPIAKANTWNCYVNQLYPMGELKQYLKS